MSFKYKKEKPVKYWSLFAFNGMEYFEANVRNCIQ